MENVHNGNIEIISFVAEYLCYTSPWICPVLLSSSGEKSYYHSGIPELRKVSSCNGIKAVVLYIIFETKRRINGKCSQWEY
jgi:hypothetical protein